LRKSTPQRRSFSLIRRLEEEPQIAQFNHIAPILRWRERFSVRLPNAKHQSGLGQDTTDFSASLLAGKTLASLRVVANAGFTIMSEPLDAAKQNDVLTYGLSATGQISPHTEVVAEISGRWSTRNGLPPIGTETRGTATFGARYTRGATRWDAAALVGTTAIDPAFGLKVGVTYVFTAFSLP